MERCTLPARESRESTLASACSPSDLARHSQPPNLGARITPCHYNQNTRRPGLSDAAQALAELMNLGRPQGAPGSPMNADGFPVGAHGYAPGEVEQEPAGAYPCAPTEEAHLDKVAQA